MATRALASPERASLARLAFGQGDYRVIYNDLAEAVAWLTHGEAE
jgi:hypothetical protein